MNRRQNAGKAVGSRLDLRTLPPTATKILNAAKRILVRRGYTRLTMQAIEREAHANRALVSYYFGGKAGLLAALVEALFEDPEQGYTQDVAKELRGVPRALALLDWQERVSANDRINRMLYELLPHAQHARQLRERFAEEYGLYRDFAEDCLADGAPDVDRQVLRDLSTLSIAVVEGLGIQRAVDPSGFDHARVYDTWKVVVSRYLEFDDAQGSLPKED